MADQTTSPYMSPKPYAFVAVLAAILAVIAWVGLRTGADPGDRIETWTAILLLMTAFAVIAGRGITGYWRGILIDERNKMSLSRLQLVAWTLVVLSAFLAAVLSNIAQGSAAPLAIEIPSEIWVLLGISTGSAVGSRAVLGVKQAQPADKTERDKTVEALRRQGHTDIDEEPANVVMTNKAPGAARWGDLLKGDEVGNAAAVDVGKLQMFFFSFILVVSYAAAIAASLRAGDVITALPPVEDGMNVLLGISHTGYLANKSISRPSKP